MLEFMVIALPRSASTWAAHWLTSDTTLCVHDPLWQHHYEDIDGVVTTLANGRVSGVSCTGLWTWTDWLNRHPARKLILHRDRTDIRRSLQRLGLPDVGEDGAARLRAINGRHIAYSDIFDPEKAQGIWKYLTNRPFDRERHAYLRTLKIETNFNQIAPDPHVTRRLATEVRNILNKSYCTARSDSWSGSAIAPRNPG